jgi:uncharacterized protein YcbK (DUF882 family)
MASGDPGLGPVPLASVGYTDAESASQSAADLSTVNQSAVEMTFSEAGTQTATYANATTTPAQTEDANSEPEFMLAVAPTSQSTAAVDAVNSVSAEATSTEGTVGTLDEEPTEIVSQPVRKQSRLARLFSFGNPRPRGEIVHLAGGSGEATPANGAATLTPRPVIAEKNPGRAELPGVRLGSLFGIGSRSNASESDEPVRVASAAGLARLAPNGLRAQSDSVQMACFKPKLVGLLKKVKRHYGRDVIVTSGYRSAKHNRRAGGARGSRHTTCDAADIQVPGVSKWQLAKYLRTVRGRGGVGTYCHTKSVHIDIGTKRDWNWRCRRR